MAILESKPLFKIIFCNIILKYQAVPYFYKNTETTDAVWKPGKWKIFSYQQKQEMEF